MQAFFGSVERWPCKLISTKVSDGDGKQCNLWLGTNSLKRDFLVYGDDSIEIEITPEKRYSVWNKKMNRFTPLGGDTIFPYASREFALGDIVTYCRRVGIREDNFTVVEYDYPGDDVA